jgi:pimeloyl-ACP methyl ester carboxylesterase
VASGVYAAGCLGIRVKCAAVLALAALLCVAANASGAQPDGAPSGTGPATGLADSAALRATVFGTPPQDIAPLPDSVPLEEINIALPWVRTVPDLFWFDRRLRVWFSAQEKPAPLAIVISGVGSDGNTANLKVLRAVLYGAGYHVLTMPSPTFPGFIVAASSTGVAGDLIQDGRDLYASMQEIISHLPKHADITDVDILGYSLGGANAAVVKSIADAGGKLKIHRAVMINPPVSLFASVARLDELFALSIGSGDAGVERLYRRLYARLANLFRTTAEVQIDESNMLASVAAVLKSDADFSAAIALTFRIALMNMFFAGDLYARTGVVVDPANPPHVGDSLEETARILRDKPFADYFAEVFAPYYLAHRANSTVESLKADNRLDIIGSASAQRIPTISGRPTTTTVILDKHRT